ncbi:MAG: LysR substrate-binding domain-containing protein [Candidatus Protistobacter heckmanni]|nr:LysR substrate-binding domain-containing protein [Candidatus Protistobacter heckmanni]
MFQYHKQLRSFHAVAKEGGFTAAADYLNVGQPTVTEQVRDLEDRFGVELFFRRGKSVGLTPAGEQLFSVTRGMFGHEEEAMQLLQNLNGHQTGLLRVGAVSPPIAIDLLARVEQAFPDLKLDLSLSTEDETLARIKDFEIDVGILALVSRDPRLHVAPYRSHPIVAIVHRDDPLAAKASIGLRELAAQPLILREPSSKTRQVVEHAAERAGLKLRPKLEINSREAIFHAVRAGMGLGFVTDIEFIELPELRAVPIERDRLRIDYFLCCLATRRERPIIAALLEQAAEGRAKPSAAVSRRKRALAK